MRGLVIVFLCGACATTAPSVAPTPTEASETGDYKEAVARAEAADLDGALAIMNRRGAALEAAGRWDAAALCWNTTTWIRWAKGDLDGALRENQRMGEILGKVEPEARAGLNLHTVWDRAYLLRDRADRVDPPERQAALAAAEAARTEYDRIAPPEESDGIAVLDAYFAWRSGDLDAAATAARKVDLDHDRDAQDLFIIARVLGDAGDPVTAERARAPIADLHYMMPPLLRFWDKTSSRK